MQALRALDSELRDWLISEGLDDPILLSGVVDEGPGLRDDLLELLDAAGLGEHLTTPRLDGLTDLYRAATPAASAFHERQAHTSDTTLYEDLTILRRQREEKSAQAERTAALAEHLAAMPGQWRGKAYRRVETPLNPAEREEAEAKKAERWSKEVLGILVEAGLPFAESAKRSRGGLGSTASLRCCRGLRANTLKKRVEDWRPYRRWLLGEDRATFPTAVEDALDYLEVQWESGAPRTFYQSWLDSLTFFEKAGERPEAERLSDTQAVKNAVRAFTTRRALQKTQAEREAPGRPARQAPPLLLNQVAAQERTVVDTSLPAYQRFYAWAKLVRHWASLRWADSEGVPPRELRPMARGLFGLLETSKTSGPDKEHKVLPLFISRGAWICEPAWLDTGRALLKGPLGYDRDYLVPLPNQDLTDTCGLRAQYSDALGLTRELLSRLEHPKEKGTPLLAPAALRFWSEHSDRAGCSGWLAALGVPADQRGLLGRWAVTSTADNYVRVAVRVVENLQNLAARAARHAYNGGPDYFGEEAVLEDLRRFLLTKGVGAEAANAQVLALTCADFSLPVPHDARTSLAQVDPTWELVHPSAEDGQPEAPDAGSLSPIPGDDALEAVNLDEVSLKEEQKARDSADCEAPPEGFVIAVTRRKVRRLHFVGNCGKIPGEHYRVFERWGNVLPPESEIDVTCSICFRGDRSKVLVRTLAPDEEGDELRAETSSSSSSESSSSTASSEADAAVVTPSKRKRRA